MQHLVRLGSIAVAALGLSLAGLTVPVSAEPDPGPAGLSAAEQRLLAQDPAIEASPDGALFAVDEWHPPTATAAASAEAEAAVAEVVAATATTDAFALHSRPGAARTIYLDFDGGSLLASNSWLLNGLNSLLFGGWSLDSLALLFSDAERAVIREVWARVAEDFAAWDVDVTTQEPLYGGLFRSSSSDPTYGARVAFTNDGAVQSQLCGGGCGGIAWIGTFNEIAPQEQHSPAWVFPSSLGQKAKNMAEAAAHEAGHTLGLAHDGSGTSGYYTGTSLWGPVMGSPYSAAVTQWSRGSYAGANNAEDDRAVIGAHGLPPRTDEAGSTPATAADLSTLPDGAGVITGPADADWYALTGCAGTLTASASPAAVGPNLDIVLELRNAAGAVVASHAPATTRTTAGLSGMGASLTVPLTGGPYYLAVSGGGSGAGGASGWSTGGYDAYGSAGAYRLLMSGCAGGTGVPVPPPSELPLEPDGPTADLPSVDPGPPTSRPGRPGAPTARSGARGGKVTVRLSWSPPAGGGGAVDGYVLKAFRLDARGRVVARTSTGALPSTTTSADVVLPRKGRWVLRVKARNALGWGPFSPRSAAAKAR
ncbi:fibronectin type III domain-containing protein [Nocardioides sp. R1-1]|uniref:fibronectin type III domain-containing protein n=1 Tax=Nocardioides sp. R1-1 TaxID=3383502 RepID=UPI0038CF7044